MYSVRDRIIRHSIQLRIIRNCIILLALLLAAHLIFPDGWMIIDICTSKLLFLDGSFIIYNSLCLLARSIIAGLVDMLYFV